jgi:hypothetical protein
MRREARIHSSRRKNSEGRGEDFVSPRTGSGWRGNRKAGGAKSRSLSERQGSRKDTHEERTFGEVLRNAEHFAGETLLKSVALILLGEFAARGALRAAGRKAESRLARSQWTGDSRPAPRSGLLQLGDIEGGGVGLARGGGDFDGDRIGGFEPGDVEVEAHVDAGKAGRAGTTD